MAKASVAGFSVVKLGVIFGVAVLAMAAVYRGRFAPLQKFVMGGN